MQFKKVLLLGSIGLISAGAISVLYKKPVSIREKPISSASVQSPELTLLSDIGATKEFTVEKIEGDYAKGNKPMTYWFAVRTDGKWKIVIEGNGIPQCVEIDAYKIPKSLFGNCIDTSGELRNSLE